MWNQTNLSELLNAIAPDVNRYCQRKEVSFEELSQKKTELLKYEQIK